jgi:hypothetical protein
VCPGGRIRVRPPQRLAAGSAVNPPGAVRVDNVGRLHLDEGARADGEQGHREERLEIEQGRLRPPPRPAHSPAQHHIARQPHTSHATQRIKPELQSRPAMDLLLSRCACQTPTQSRVTGHRPPAWPPAQAPVCTTGPSCSLKRVDGAHHRAGDRPRLSDPAGDPGLTTHYPHTH